MPVKDSGVPRLLCSSRAFAACFVLVNTIQRMMLATALCSCPTNSGGAECSPTAEPPFGAWRSASSRPATHLHPGQRATGPGPEEQFLRAPSRLMCALILLLWPMGAFWSHESHRPSSPCWRSLPRAPWRANPSARDTQRATLAPFPSNRLRLRAAGYPGRNLAQGCRPIGECNLPACSAAFAGTS